MNKVSCETAYPPWNAMISLMLKHILQMGWGVSLLFKNKMKCQSAILNGETMEILTIMDGIIHCIYATFHVDLMYDSELMNQKVSKFAIFLIFFGRKSPIFS